MGNGEVLVNNQPLRNKLARFIDKKIHQWAEHRFEHRPQSPPAQTESNNNNTTSDSFATSTAKEGLHYTVAFTEESDEKQIGCITEIYWGGTRWRGYDLSNDTQSAFIHSLKRLQPH